MKCKTHDEHDTRGKCSCSEIVKAMRTWIAETLTAIGKEERYLEMQGTTVAERAYRVGWNDAMRRVEGLFTEAMRTHTSPTVKQLYVLVEPPEYSETCSGCVAYAHAAVDDVLDALGVSLPLG
jgi:hypothetical protein